MTMTVEQVIKDFFNLRGNAKTPNVYLEGNKLICFGATVAQWIKGEIVLNVTSYSDNIGKVQNQIMQSFPYCRKVSDVPIGLNDLKYFV
jgi:hypothetical protein